jgi:aspartokinase
MAAIGVIAGVVSAVAGIAGTLVAAKGAADAGEEQRRAREYEAKQREMQGQESRAASQRQALEKDRASRLAQSTLQSRAAASGAGATDETVLGLGEDIAGRGEYQRLMEMYTGENRARGLDDAAMGLRMTGAAEAKAGRTRATGTLLSGLGSFGESLGKIKW